jgi:hypothetical protein
MIRAFALFLALLSAFGWRAGDVRAEMKGDGEPVRFALVGTRLGGNGLALGDSPHGEISVACEACHTPTAWRPVRDTLLFSHSRQTDFPLTGRHEQVACQSCHLGLRFDEPEAFADDCQTCHLDVHRGNLGDDCARCHSTQDFRLTRGAEVHAQTAFPLTGAHLQVTCESCHAADQAGLFTALDPDCYACHAPDYAATAGATNAQGGSFDHVAAGFPTDCAQCHTTLSFGGARFDHAAQTGFNLIGAHAVADCAGCHTSPGLGLVFDAASEQDCIACHQADYQRAAPLDHVAFALPTDCDQCHGLVTFEGARFDHAAQAGFALVGAHMAAPCTSCHASGSFEPLFDAAGPDDCQTCHEADYARAHADSAFPTTCQQCHGTTAWEGAAFDHAAQTGFPLVGIHVSQPCTACHVDGSFEPLFTPAGADDCVECHQQDYAAGHPAGNFPTTCADCHQPTATWEGATFDHQKQTGFPLVGVHMSQPCTACHASGTFEPLFDPAGAQDCYACHADDYAAEHVGTGFPTTCTTCHALNSWQGATVDHPQFPIYSGRHEGEWSSCQTCHTAPGSFEVFSCITCHEHNRAEMVDEHEDVGGFVYESTACYSCHPDGED